jgi:hypothetical protein
MRVLFAGGARWMVGPILCLSLLVSAESNRAPAQPKDGGLPPLNQAAVDESIARGIEYLKGTQKDDGTWDEGGHPVGCTALTGIALVESGVRLSDPAVSRAAAYIRAKANTLTDTYQISLAIIFLDRLKDPKRDDHAIQLLAARLMAGQTATGGWTYSVTGGPRNLAQVSDAETKQMLAALKKMTPPPITSEVSYRERPSRLGLCIKQSEDIIVKPSKAALDASEYDKKRGAIVKELPTNLKNRVVFQDPAKYDALDPRDRKDLIAAEKGDNSNTHFAMIGLWTARKHGVPTERSFTLVAKRFRTSQDPGSGGWGYDYPVGSTHAMTCVGLLGLAIGNALAVDPAAGRPEQDQAILKSLKFLGTNIGAPTGQFKDRPKVKDAGGLYYFWALERIAVLYDISTLDKKDWYRWGAEILIANQLPDGSWTEGGFPGGEKGAVCTPLAILFLKRANLTPDLSKRLIIDSSALTAKVNEPKPAPPPPPPPKVEPPKSEPPPKIEPKKEEPPPAPPVMTPTVATPPSESVAAKKESKPIWPWLVGGLGLVMVIGVGLILVVRKKGDEDEDEDDDEEEEEKPKKKKSKSGTSVKKKGK